jgi:hypothetical protein
VKRIHAQRTKARRDRSWPETFPPGLRDPDVARAKARARARRSPQEGDRPGAVKVTQLAGASGLWVSAAPAAKASPLLPATDGRAAAS